MILRACNELLRRLSRAEDTVFCGRVFIFLFQSFPLGDKSSVNLRGEYHVDNVTAFDKVSTSKNEALSAMEMDVDDQKSQPQNNGEQAPSSHSEIPQIKANEEGDTDAKATKDAVTVQDSQKPIMDTDTLYPIFWSLQEYFSTPVRLFDPSNLKLFKRGLEATLGVFRHVCLDLERRSNSKALEDNKRGAKRKRGVSGEDSSILFNPKYLTSRDLFELEVSSIHKPLRNPS